MTTALALPDPQAFAVADLRDRLIPAIRGIREEVRNSGDLATADELRRRIEAFRRYVTDRRARTALEVEARHTELLIGHLLGPGEVGRPGSGEITHASVIPRQDRVRFRLLAAHEDEVEALLAADHPVVARGKLLDAIQRNGHRANEPRPLVDGTYSVITADPPWKYDNRATRAAAESHYRTLDIDELKALVVDGMHVRERADVDAHLYLWTTNAFLREAFEILDAWDFEYKTTLTWVKGKTGKGGGAQLGIGNYFRSCTEHVLFGIRGSLKVRNSNQPNWFESRRGRHSRKPDLFYDLVEAASPGPYLELFARTDLLPTRPGWTVWGNEA